MAGLAFVNHDHAFISQGTYCYLPVRPFWYRLALSWIPRYLILATITGLYLAIYCYVKVQFKQLGDETRESYLESVTENPRTMTTNQTAKESNYASEPSSPLPGSNNLSGTTARESSTRKNSKRSSTSEIPSWERYSFGTTNPVPPSEAISYTDTSVLEPAPAPVTQSARRVSTTSSMTDKSSKRVSIAQALRDMRINSMAPFPRRNSKPAADPVHKSDTDPNAAATAAPDSVPDPFVLTALRRRHRAIKRQVRLLFVYPLVYMAVWIVPFVSHCLQYSDYFSKNPPFILQCFSTSILALQCAVDCCLFSFREKPWRHIDALTTPPVLTGDDYFRAKKKKEGRSGKFWPSLKFWEITVQQSRALELGILRRPVPVPGKEKAGKSKAEMAWEGGIARHRRDLEEARNRESWGELERKRRESEERRGGRSRQWWEGKMRKESIMLGTEGSKDEPNRFFPPENIVRSPTIMEEGGEGGEDSENDEEDVSPRNSRQASTSHSQELEKVRKGKKSPVYHPGIARDVGHPNAENMDLDQPQASDASIDWAAVYADDDWRAAAGVAGRFLGKTKAELEANAGKAVKTKMTGRGYVYADDMDAGGDDPVQSIERDSLPPTLPPIPRLPKLQLLDTGGDTDTGTDGDGAGDGAVKMDQGKGRAKRKWKGGRPLRNVMDGKVFTPEDERPPPHLRVDALCRE